MNNFTNFLANIIHYRILFQFFISYTVFKKNFKICSRQTFIYSVKYLKKGNKNKFSGRD